MDFLDTFIIADYIRTWMFYGRGIEYSSCLYYNTSTKELYATHTNETYYFEFREKIIYIYINGFSISEKKNP